MANFFSGGGWTAQKLIILGVIVLVCLGLLYVLAGVVGIAIPGWIMTMLGIFLAGLFVIVLVRLIFFVGGGNGTGT